MDLKNTVAEEIRDKRDDEILNEYNYACGDELMGMRIKRDLSLN